MGILAAVAAVGGDDNLPSPYDQNFPEFEGESVPRSAAPRSPRSAAQFPKIV